MEGILMDFKKTLISSVAAAGLLFSVGQPFNVLAEQPSLFQYKGDQLQVTQIGQYDSLAGEGGTEILAYDEKLKRAFVTNGAVSGMDILSFKELKSGKFTNIESKATYLCKRFRYSKCRRYYKCCFTPNRRFNRFNGCK